MFSQLFAESGLSLDRLKALLEVGAAGSIVKAADGDPVRQSQYSRQIKELEEFFRSRLIERQGRGARLTASGKELARISRFFLLGLSNFRRGCLAEEQTFRIGACATFIRQFLLPVLSGPSMPKARRTYAVEAVANDESERRLHDLTLDFGVVESAVLSRPLQTRALGQWKLQLWVPKGMRLGEAKAAQAFEARRLPLVLARELDGLGVAPGPRHNACLVCDSFLEAKAALEGGQVAGLLPDFLAPARTMKSFVRINIPKLDAQVFQFYLAWNPRLLRLNPHATRRRDWLAEALTRQMGG
jgi:DNA-binding transcriptional LysR family regulator